MDVSACLRRVRERDEEAARALVDHLFPLVMKIVRAHLPRRLDAEDLAQMVFAKVFAHIDQYGGAVPFEHWVSRIAVNTCINQLRSERIRPEWRRADLSEEEEAVLEKVVAATQEPDPSEQMASRDLVQKMLGTLSAEDRLVISLLDLEGRSVQEIKNITGWNRSLIKVRAFRARIKLRKQLAKLLKEHIR